VKTFFENLASEVNGLIAQDEIIFGEFQGENSTFCRFNNAKIRQLGTVKQAQLNLRLIQGRKNICTDMTLNFDLKDDLKGIQAALNTMRASLKEMDDDPFLLINTEAQQSSQTQVGQIPGFEELYGTFEGGAAGTDAVGIYAGGPVVRAMFSSLGHLHWSEQETFSFDWSCYLERDRAVKQSYSGQIFDEQVLEQKWQQIHRNLEVMQRPSREIKPGRYRAYLAPAAMQEVANTLAWGGFGIKAIRSQSSPLGLMYHENKNLSSKVSLYEDFSRGVAPRFSAEGFERPAEVSLIENGKMQGQLVSARSAVEYGLNTTACAYDESPEALVMKPGNLSLDQVAARLGEGLWIENLWYLNYSDRLKGRITGMTRFATFWVEGGKVASPIKVMRFDDSIYSMLGDELEDLTSVSEFMPDPSTYSQRSTAAMTLPGALLGNFALTL
jgi:predicted Zn-dependent protease